MLLKLFIANLKMLLRNRQTLFWAMVFPVLLIVVFGLFNLDEPPTSKLAVVDQASNAASENVVDALGEIETLEVSTAGDVDDAKQQLADGELDFVLVLPEQFSLPPRPGSQQSLTLFEDPANVQANAIVRGTLESFADKTTLGLAQVAPAFAIEAVQTESRNVRYVDFLMPGIIGQAIMMSAIMGTAVGISRYREQQVLRRLLATPLPTRTFLIAEVLSRLCLAVLQTSLILLTARLMFDVHVYGSYLWVYALALLGNLIFIQVGFTIAGVARSASAAEGLSNVVAMPLLILSGVFFAIDTLPDGVQAFVRLLPLTPLIETLRGVILHADVPWPHATELGIVVVWALVTFLSAWHTFRFDHESR